MADQQIVSCETNSAKMFYVKQISKKNSLKMLFPYLQMA